LYGVSYYNPDGLDIFKVLYVFVGDFVQEHRHMSQSGSVFEVLQFVTLCIADVPGSKNVNLMYIGPCIIVIDEE